MVKQAVSCPLGLRVRLLSKLTLAIVVLTGSVGCGHQDGDQLKQHNQNHSNDTDQATKIAADHPSEGNASTNPNQRDQVSGDQPVAGLAASLLSGASFFVTEGDENQGNKVSIGIKRSSLDQEFLLQVSTTQMPFLGTSNSSRSRIVAFKKQGDELFMLETGTGHVVTNDVDQVFVLARFNILAETPSHIMFDFNQGMRDIFVAGEWRASDIEGATPFFDAEALAVRLSYLENAEIVDEEKLIVTQVAQVDGDVGSYQDLVGGRTTFSATYYLTPYQPSPDFVATAGGDFSSFGYFEVAPMYDEQGVAKVYASKFGTGPITFAISENTPPDYLDAVRSGVLYWNKAFGFEKIKVEIAPEGVTAPNFFYNVVQWLNWDDAGFAYADAQADPRTGQITHAQVYMTSAFAVSSVKRAQELVQKIADQGSSDDDSSEEGTVANSSANSLATAPRGKHTRLSLNQRGLGSANLCFRELGKRYGEELAGLLQREDVTDAKVLRLSQDYVREVVAHEIGHTLGLRHNFAGSTAANVSAQQLAEAFDSYVTTGESPTNLNPGSSVMDYNNFRSAVMLGSNLEVASTALTYDRAAIANLYQDAKPLGEEETSEQPLHFCTDSHVGFFNDCLLFDFGSSPVDAIKVETAARLESYLTPLETEDDDSETLPLAYYLPPDLAAATVLQPLERLPALLSPNLKLIGVRGNLYLPGLDDLYRQEEAALVANEVNDLGGFGAVLPFSLELPTPRSPLEMILSENFAAAYGKRLLTILAGSGPRDIGDGPASELYEEFVGNFGVRILTEVAGEPTTAPTDEDSSGDSAADPLVESAANLPKDSGSASEEENENAPVQFEQSFAVRMQAAEMIRPGRGVSLDYLLGARLTAADQIRQTVEKAIGEDIETVDLLGLDQATRLFVEQNRAILAALR